MKIKLAVYGSEGPIPHFHFYKDVDINKGIPKKVLNRGGCICITQPYYFLHGSHKEKLNSKEIKGLLEFLELDIIDKESNEIITNWDKIIELWNRFNPGNKVSSYINIPDYKYDMNSINNRKKISSYYDDIFNLDIENLFNEKGED